MKNGDNNRISVGLSLRIKWCKECKGLTTKEELNTFLHYYWHLKFIKVKQLKVYFIRIIIHETILKLIFTSHCFRI